MSLRKKPFIQGEYYHLYNRGNSKQQIFHDEDDYHRFLKLLYLMNSNRRIDFRRIVEETYAFDREILQVSVGAYCVMPNHFHILVTQAEKGSISKFMQKLTTAYVMYYNKKYKRTGSLFEGKFKAEHVNNDRYLKYLFSYIHLNPIKIIDTKWKEKGIANPTKAFQYLDEYPFSSYFEYISHNRSEQVILSKQDFPDYFPNERSIKREVSDWFNYREGKTYAG